MNFRTFFGLVDAVSTRSGFLAIRHIYNEYIATLENRAVMRPVRREAERERNKMILTEERIRNVLRRLACGI